MISPRFFEISFLFEMKCRIRGTPQDNRLIYGGRELPLKILKFVGIIFVIIFQNFDLLLIFLFKIKKK